MNLIKIILVISLGGMAYHYWQKNNTEYITDIAYVSDNGFVTLPKPANFKADSVMVIAAANCTKEAARRADQLVTGLEQRHIPHTRVHRVNFNDFNPSMKKQLDSVMRGPLPIVLVNGKGKSNPTLEDVLSEYNSFDE